MIDKTNEYKEQDSIIEKSESSNDNSINIDDSLAITDDECKILNLLMNKEVEDDKVLNSNINTEDRSSMSEDDENVKLMNDTDELSFCLERVDEREVAILKEYKELQNNTLVAEKWFIAKIQ